MDSVGQHRSDYDRVFFGSLFSETGRRRSTSQTCLHKILTVITTVPPPLSAAASPPFSGSETKESSPENDANDENKVALCVPPEAKEYEADAALVEGGGGSSAVHRGGYCEGNLENDAGVVREDSRMRVEEEADDGRSLILLIEAAKLIFGDFKDGDESDCGEEDGSQCSELKKDEAAAAADITEPNGRKLRRRSSCWMAAEMGGGFVETASSAVVRSKRGRTTVLPLKYRDSVLEPLNRLTRPGSSIFPSKRRRR